MGYCVNSSVACIEKLMLLAFSEGLSFTSLVESCDDTWVDKQRRGRHMGRNPSMTEERPKLINSNCWKDPNTESGELVLTSGIGLLIRRLPVQILVAKNDRGQGTSPYLPRWECPFT